jgi:hypothetical protein
MRVDLRCQWVTRGGIGGHVRLGPDACTLSSMRGMTLYSVFMRNLGSSGCFEIRYAVVSVLSSACQ